MTLTYWPNHRNLLKNLSKFVVLVSPVLERPSNASLKNTCSVYKTVIRLIGLYIVCHDFRLCNINIIINYFFFNFIV